MKKIDSRGNMPPHVALFARELTGAMSGQEETEFWEASTVEEFEKNAAEIGYEIVPSVDSSTDRAFLVGFHVEEPKHVVTLTSYAKLKMYFVELTVTQYREWAKKIAQHRLDQQKDMFDRRERAQKARNRAERRREQRKRR